MDNKFNELQAIVLKRYNQRQDTPVDTHDRYFKSYLLGALSAVISDESLDTAIARFSEAAKLLD